MNCEKVSEKKSKSITKSRDIHKSRDNTKSREYTKSGDYQISLPKQSESKTIKRPKEVLEKSRFDVEEKENQRKAENQAH
jgi:hypothetical protein